MSIANLSPSQLRQAADLMEKIAGLKKQLAQLLGAKAPPVAVIPIKKKGGMSAAGKARISAAARLRWAKIKAAKAAPAAKASAPKSVAKVIKKRIISPAARAKMAAAAKAMWAAKKAKK